MSDPHSSPHKLEIVPAASARPLVSVIVTSHSPARLKDIEDLLESLVSQTYPSVEIVLVVDKSRLLWTQVRTLWAKKRISNLHVHFNEGSSGLASARNRGVQQAKGEIIAFIDDDATAFPDWVEEIVKTFASRPDVIGATGPAYPAWETPSMAWLPEELYWLISCSSPTEVDNDRFRAIRNAWGVNMAFRQEAFRVCWFDEHLGWNMGQDEFLPAGPAGEDMVFSLQVAEASGQQIVHNPRIRVRHKARAYRLKDQFVRRRSFWEGYTKGTLVKHYNKGMNVTLSVESSTLRRILFGLLPRTLWYLPRGPSLAWRKLALTVTVLLHVALGYLAARSAFLGKVVVRHYS